MTNNRKLAVWLLTVSTLIIVLIVYGGWVRLTRSGLSIVEWNVVTGVVPPLGADAWESEFAKYRQTPEYQIVNFGMPLEEFKFIYYMEFGHRLLGRITGLLFVGPLFYFLFRRTIPRTHIPSYLGIGLLFALQGLVGWLMVKSGLSDRPQVNHLRLTLHLSCALALLATCLWRAFDYLSSMSFPPNLSRTTRRLCAGLFVSICLQIATGGLVAGLKAGHVSDTFPKMFGVWLPQGLWAMQPPLANLFDNAVTIHFQHRFFAFAVLAVAIALFAVARNAAPLKNGRYLLLGLLGVQIGLGIATVLLHVPLGLASLHQAVAVALFVTSLFLCHRAYGYPETSANTT